MRISVVNVAIVVGIIGYAAAIAAMNGCCQEKKSPPYVMYRVDHLDGTGPTSEVIKVFGLPNNKQACKVLADRLMLLNHSVYRCQMKISNEEK